MKYDKAIKTLENECSKINSWITNNYSRVLDPDCPENHKRYLRKVRAKKEECRVSIWDALDLLKAFNK